MKPGQFLLESAYQAFFWHITIGRLAINAKNQFSHELLELGGLTEQSTSWKELYRS